jgi:hypothetical protein
LDCQTFWPGPAVKIKQLGAADVYITTSEMLTKEGEFGRRARKMECEIMNQEFIRTEPYSTTTSSLNSAKNASELRSMAMRLPSGIPFNQTMIFAPLLQLRGNSVQSRGAKNHLRNPTAKLLNINTNLVPAAGSMSAVACSASMILLKKSSEGVRLKKTA